MQEGINVLSLFDGISCGQIALDRIGIKVKNYIASEIKNYAIKCCIENYPNTIHVGDVKNIDIIKEGVCINISKDNKKIINCGVIDLLIGGSPCKQLSSLNFYKENGDGLDGADSRLFYEYVRIYNQLKIYNP